MIRQIDTKTGKVIKIWNSQTEASRALGIDQSQISKACNGRNKTAGKFGWENTNITPDLSEKHRVKYYKSRKRYSRKYRREISKRVTGRGNPNYKG